MNQYCYRKFSVNDIVFKCVKQITSELNLNNQRNMKIILLSKNPIAKSFLR